jgi:hypothetical protein
MRWRERSVRGRAIALRAVTAVCFLALGPAILRIPILWVIVLLAAWPLTVLYYSIACPRCGNFVLRPRPWDPARCQECGLPTNQAWPQK